LQTTINNKDLLRIILWFCSKETGDIRIFEYGHRLQQIMFLAQNEFLEFKKLKESGVFIDDEFEFKGNNFGPFSGDLKEMISVEFRIEDKEISVIKKGHLETYKINPAMIKKLKEKYLDLKENQIFIDWVKKISKLRLMESDELLRRVYENEKYYKYLLKERIGDKFTKFN